MAENAAEDDIAICPLCYCPFNPRIEPCPECDGPSVEVAALPEAIYVNVAENHNWFGHFWRLISNRLPRFLFRSNEK
ncbi:MAG: hypothetical protein ACE5IJ_02960 [Thermoplasmata archaeon]